MQGEINKNDRVWISKGFSTTEMLKNLSRTVTITLFGTPRKVTCLTRTLLMLIQKKTTAPDRRACLILADPISSQAQWQDLRSQPLPGVHSCFLRDQSRPCSQGIVVLYFDLPGGSVKFTHTHLTFIHLFQNSLKGEKWLTQKPLDKTFKGK